MKWIVQLRNGSRLIVDDEYECGVEEEDDSLRFHDDDGNLMVSILAETVLYYGREDKMEVIQMKPQHEGDDPFAGLMPSMKPGTKVKGEFISA